MLSATHTHARTHTHTACRRRNQWLCNFPEPESAQLARGSSGILPQSHCFYPAHHTTPFRTVVLKANADCEIIKHCVSHFLSTSCCSQLTHAITWQTCECDKVNLDSATNRKWILLWRNSNSNHFDKRKIGKKHSRPSGMFSKDKRLFVDWADFFLNTDKIWVFWKMAQAQDFVYLPGQGKWKWYVGAQSDLQGGRCYVPCGLGGHEHITQCTAWKCPAPLMLLNRKMQSHFISLSVMTCFSLNASMSKFILYRQCHQANVIHCIKYKHKCRDQWKDIIFLMIEIKLWFIKLMIKTLEGWQCFTLISLFLAKGWL